MSTLNINASTGIVTSNNTSQLNIVTQPTSTGWNASVNAGQTLANINRITIHHTTNWDTDGPLNMTLAGLNATWANQPGGAWHHPGYHFVIRTNGDVWQISRLTRTSNGAFNHNTNNIHIAVMGLFWDGVGERPRRNNGVLMVGPAEYSSQQRTALQRLVQGLLNNSVLSRVTGNNHVFGHRDLSGHEWNRCPGLTRANLHAAITPPPPPTISGTFRVSRGNTFVGTAPNAGQIANIGVGGTFVRSGEMQIAGNWTWLRGRLTGTSVNPNTLVWIATSQLERHAGTNGIHCQITDPQRFGFTSVRNTPAGPNIFNCTGNAIFRPIGHSSTAGGFSWRLGTIIGSNISALNGTTVWVASTQFAPNSHTVCR